VPTLGSSLWPLRMDADGHSLVLETTQGDGVGEQVATLGSSPWLVRVDGEGLSFGSAACITCEMLCEV